MTIKQRGCNLPELRKQLETMQELLDTYEHCHVDSVTPEEKIVKKVKQACIKAYLIEKEKSKTHVNTQSEQKRVIQAIKSA